MADAQFEADHPRGRSGRFAGKPLAGRSRAAEAGLRRAASGRGRVWNVEVVETGEDDWGGPVEAVVESWTFDDEDAAVAQAAAVERVLAGQTDEFGDGVLSVRLSDVGVSDAAEEFAVVWETVVGWAGPAVRFEWPHRRLLRGEDADAVSGFLPGPWEERLADGSIVVRGASEADVRARVREVIARPAV